MAVNPNLPAVPGLSHAEWQAVAIALHDAARGRDAAPPAGMAPRPLARAWQWLIGAEPPRPLTDPRLDAVRPFAGAVRRHGSHARDLVPELLGFGYTPAQVEALRRVAA